MRKPGKLPRRAYCNGCDHTYPKMHLLRDHRRTDRCGGRFLSAEERAQVDKLRLAREALDREMRAIKKLSR